MSIRFFLISLLCLPLLLPAQDEKSERSCRILFLSPAADAPKTLYLYDGRESIEVNLPSMNLSKVHKLPPGPLILRLLQEPVSDPELVPANAPGVQIAENLNDIYLLVTSDRSNPVAPVRLAIVNADHARVGKGEMLWFNLTDKNIGGRLGSQKLRMRPKESVVVNAPASGRESYPVEIFFNLPGESDIHPMFETIWRHDPRGRSLIFIMDDNRRRVPRILSFNDFRS